MYMFVYMNITPSDQNPYCQSSSKAKCHQNVKNTTAFPEPRSWSVHGISIIDVFHLILATLRRQGKVDENVNNDISDQEVVHRFGHVDGAIFHSKENGHDGKNKAHVTCNRQIISLLI